MNIKKIIKHLLSFSPIPLTKNQLYDRQTKKVIQKVLKKDSNCIDVGCHKGEILDIMLKHCPQGHHYGFEPIPSLYDDLVKKYRQQENCTILKIALSNQSGETSFNYVLSNPSYSGLKKRKYDRPSEEDRSIQVQTELLDHLIPENFKVDLIKIDVEGGELWVLEGAKKTVQRNQPIIIFEHGLGASEFYDSNPTKVYSLLSELGMQVSTLTAYLIGNSSLDKHEFEEQYRTGKNYYFIAHPHGN